jgi:hypothetical protein
MTSKDDVDDDKQVSVRLPTTLYATIKRAAAAQDRSVSAQIRHLAAKALEDRREVAA